MAEYQDLRDRLDTWLKEHVGTEKGVNRKESLKRYFSTLGIERLSDADAEQRVQINEWFTELQD